MMHPVPNEIKQFWDLAFFEVRAIVVLMAKVEINKEKHGTGK